ncbi:hypothetical protein ACH5RR_006298 [Cinchona calisaya]|uniref:Uncharacterized protein n=1 Tax=Cinchona calisaya TaxID=153742 RepID=A0ABD3ANK7_9GENT
MNSSPAMVSSSTISAIYNLNLADGTAAKYSMRKTSLIASKSDERCGSTAVEFRHSEIDQSKNIDVATLCPLDNVFLLIGAAQDLSMAAPILSVGEKDTPSVAGEITVNVVAHQGKKGVATTNAAAIHKHAAEIPQGNKFATANGQKLRAARVKRKEAAVAALPMPPGRSNSPPQMKILQLLTKGKKCSSNSCIHKCCCCFSSLSRHYFG